MQLSYRDAQHPMFFGTVAHEAEHYFQDQLNRASGRAGRRNPFSWSQRGKPDERTVEASANVPMVKYWLDQGYTKADILSYRSELKPYLDSLIQVAQNIEPSSVAGDMSKAVKVLKSVLADR